MKPGQLIEHPEGGRFREVFRSPRRVRAACGTERSAITHIYFALGPGESSRFHRVASDEVWNLYEGAGVLLYLWDDMSGALEERELSRESGRYCHVVPAGTWQAAVPLDGAVLVGCSVAPGFEFADFALLEAESDKGRRLAAIRPDLAGLLFALDAHERQTADRGVQAD